MEAVTAIAQSQTTLLGRDLAPLTREIGFIETDAGTISADFVEHRNAVLKRASFSSAEVRGIDLRELICRLSPLTDGSTSRYLFVPTQGRWTAFFDNRVDGTDGAVLSHYAERLRCRAVRASHVPDDAEAGEQSGAVILEVFGPEPTDFLNYERSIVLANDGGRWVFEQSGDPYPFENVDAYAARRLRDRFTPELLDSYLRELGISMFDEGFYAPGKTAILVEDHGRRDREWKDYEVPGCRDR